jgi:tellurite resistance protein TerC
MLKMASLFPFIDYWHLYAWFIVFVLGIIVIDLGVFHKTPHKISIKEAGIWSVVWILLALSFCYALYSYSLTKFDPLIAKKIAFEYLTGYVIEKSLSIDNIFVFVVIFRYFQVPAHLQHRVLFFGILGAILFRAIFIAIGSVLIQYQWVLLAFGIFLIFTGIKICITNDDKPKDLSDNFLLKYLNKLLPISKDYDGQKFTTKIDQKTFFTPLFITLIMVEFSDLIFAVDSVPAIFAITNEPFIVFTSNIMAILGLRSLYFLLAESVDLFHYLKYGLGIVLVFVGIKMTFLNKLYDGHFPNHYSLLFIVSVITLSIVLSLLSNKNKAKES